jgi:hypothetical protein
MPIHRNIYCIGLSCESLVNFCGLFNEVFFFFSISIIQNVPGEKVSILGGHSVGHSKQDRCIYTCVLFRTVSEIELFNCRIPKLLVRNRYYVLFLTPVFIVQVTKLVQFT